jgi:hypothetical protein
MHVKYLNKLFNSFINTDLNQPTVADDIIKNKKGSLIKFFIFGELVDKPPLDVPYYPLVDTGSTYIDIDIYIYLYQYKYLYAYKYIYAHMDITFLCG